MKLESLKNICLSKAKANKAPQKIASIEPKYVSPITKEQLAQLRQIAPDVVFFTADSDDDSNDDSSDSDTLTALSGNEQSDSENSDVENDYPTMMDILKMHHITCNAELLDATKHINFNSLEFMTRGQKNASWRKQRCGRLTSSKFGQIFKRKKDEIFPLSFFEMATQCYSPSIQWGIANEKVALNAYIQWSKHMHPNMKVEEAGLFVSKTDPYLAASPDAIVSCECCKKGVIEIKCPFKHKDKRPTDIYKFDRSFYLDANEDLRENSNYYAQVQGQMAIVDVEYCDFVVWTPIGIHVQRINRDRLFWEANKDILKDFFFQTSSSLFYKNYK